MLDSGAFSAWTKKTSIDIGQYADYILKHEKHLENIVNLDVIPSYPGKPPSAIEVRESAKKGFQNYKYLIKRGVPREKLIHVFHQGEPFSVLKKMAGEMEYIGLSPANDKTTAQKKVFLEECMKYVTNSNGEALVKFHGFAVTSIELMSSFPWYSVDSASAFLQAAQGNLWVPFFRGGVWDYKHAPRMCYCGDNPKNKPTEKELKLVKHYLDIMGVPEFFEGPLSIFNEYKTRMLLNCMFLLEIEKEVFPTYYERPRRGLF